MSHAKVKLDYTQKNRTNGQTLLMSVEQYTGLELDRLQAKENYGVGQLP